MRRIAAAALASLALVACAESADPGVFDLIEFSITGPERLDAGPATLTVNNAGEFSHTLVVTNSADDVIAATPLIPGGTSVELDVDLAPGNYWFTCRIVAQDDEGNLSDHYLKGMATTVEVTG
ncbi:MAG TPA: hypothetical protein VG872_12070 [Acidimicrobiia bacterium]|nr:hypothetical protein [Acidimicrobiia bacterium]